MQAHYRPGKIAVVTDSVAQVRSPGLDQLITEIVRFFDASLQPRALAAIPSESQRPISANPKPIN